MPQWSTTDNAANSVFWAAAMFNLPANSSNRTSLYNNTTPNSIVNGAVIGQFAVGNNEIQGVGNVISITLLSAGSGYLTNTTVTVSGNATANARANGTTGKLINVNVVWVGSNYAAQPNVTIAAPPTMFFNANSDVLPGNAAIIVTNHVFQNNDVVRYGVAAGNTALGNLTPNATYFVVQANSTGLRLANTPSGNPIVIAKGLTQNGHSFTGETGIAVATIGGGRGTGIAHTGWVIRREGTGQRAGRVSYEVLVAGGIVDGTGDDSILPGT